MNEPTESQRWARFFLPLSVSRARSQSEPDKRPGRLGLELPGRMCPPQSGGSVTCFAWRASRPPTLLGGRSQAAPRPWPGPDRPDDTGRRAGTASGCIAADAANIVTGDREGVAWLRQGRSLAPQAWRPLCTEPFAALVWAALMRKGQSLHTSRTPA